jgi:glutaminyl-peptide cyclotransferase
MGGGLPSSEPIAMEDRRGPGFDADAAFALLERQVAFGPRAPGTPGHAAQLAWMTDYLEARADTVVVQRFEHTGPEGETLALANVWARFRPAAEDRVLLVAHWDTRPTADRETDPADRDRPIPGANDGASGVAVLLQLADVLSRHSPPLGVDLLLVDGEDYAPDHMFLGATHFAEHRPPDYRPLYGVVVDMVADRTPRYEPEGYSRDLAPEVVERVWSMAERLGYGEHFPRTIGFSVRDDHVPLNEAGIRTANIIDFEYGPGNAYWHTLEDDLHNVAPDGLGMVGRVLAELIYRGG